MKEYLRARAAKAPTNLGIAVNRRRAALSLSQEELAARAQLHRTYVSDIERGTRNPSLKTLYRLAEALEMQCSKLVELAEAATVDGATADDGVA